MSDRLDIHDLPLQAGRHACNAVRWKLNYGPLPFTVTHADYIDLEERIALQVTDWMAGLKHPNDAGWSGWPENLPGVP